MSNLKKIKRELKRKHVWKTYKEVFKHKQMKFVYSNVALLFNKDINIKKLVSAEVKLTKVKKDQKMFVETFSTLSSITKDKIDWESFGKFMWFQYQTSTYWKDVKKGRDNIFNRDNYVQMNAEKRKYWQNWLSSLDKSNEHFNNMVTSVLRKVF